MSPVTVTMKKASDDTTDTESSYHDTPPPSETPPPYYGSVEYELSEHGSFSDPRRFSVGLLQEAGYLDENLLRCKRQKPSSPVPFAGPDASAPPDLDGAEQPATSFAELRRRAELANKKAEAAAEAAAAAAAFEQKPAVADSEVCVPTSDTPPHPADRRFPSTGGGATPSASPGAGRRGGPLPDRLAPLYRGQRVWDGSVCSQARAVLCPRRLRPPHDQDRPRPTVPGGGAV